MSKKLESLKTERGYLRTMRYDETTNTSHSVYIYEDYINPIKERFEGYNTYYTIPVYRLSIHQADYTKLNNNDANYRTSQQFLVARDENTLKNVLKHFGYSLRNF